MNFNIKHIAEDQLFCLTVKPTFIDKTLTDQKFTLLANNRIDSDENELSWKYFGSTIKHLEIDAPSSIF